MVTLERIAPMQIMFDVPPLASGGTFEIKVHLCGKAGLTGPESAATTASLQLFGAPREGTLSGTALQRGNIGGDLLSTKGHFMCDVVLKPIVHRFQLAPMLVELDFDFGDSNTVPLASADDDASCNVHAV
jgi:hypothetical protein